jgi:transcriptional regulator with XRE-family HTH domain
MRERRGWSKSELARRAGLNQTTVSAVESGRLIPYDTQLLKLAKALGVPDPEALLDEVTPDG